MEFEHLPEKIQNTIKQFITPHIENINTLAIFIVGSYTTKNIDPNSDIDIYIIQEKIPTRTRGNTWINDIEIEYFINPYEQVNAYLQDEGRFRPVTATMIANGIECYHRNDQKAKEVITKIKNEAKKVISEPLEISKTEMELFKYTIDDLVKDMKDTIGRKEALTYNLLYGDLCNKLIEIIFRINKLKLPKKKLMRQSINKIEPEFIALLDKSLKSPMKIAYIEEVVEYVEALLGGKRTKEWVLTSSLTI